MQNKIQIEALTRMKFLITTVIFVMFLFVACKKKDVSDCPILLFPKNHQVYHSGDTLPISIYWPPQNRPESDSVVNCMILGNTHTSVDSEFVLPVKNNYASTTLILNFTGPIADSVAVDISNGPFTTVDCHGATIYIQH